MHDTLLAKLVEAEAPAIVKIRLLAKIIEPTESRWADASPQQKREVEALAVTLGWARKTAALNDNGRAVAVISFPPDPQFWATGQDTPAPNPEVPA